MEGTTTVTNFFGLNNHHNNNYFRISRTPTTSSPSLYFASSTTRVLYLQPINKNPVQHKNLIGRHQKSHDTTCFLLKSPQVSEGSQSYRQQIKACCSIAGSRLLPAHSPFPKTSLPHSKMVRQEVDGRTRREIFIQRPGTTYFHIIWGVHWRPASDASYFKDRESIVTNDLIDQPPPYEPVKLKEPWVNTGNGVWQRKLVHCSSIQWGINTHKQVDKSSGPDPNANLTFTCKGMLRQPKRSTEAALNTICRNIALSLFLHRQKHRCTCDLRFLRLGRVDLAFNNPAAHRCPDATLRLERLLPGKTVFDWIHLHDALCYCCCFSSGLYRPTRFSSPRPNQDYQNGSGNIRKTTHSRSTMTPSEAVWKSGHYTGSIVNFLWRLPWKIGA